MLDPAQNPATPPLRLAFAVVVFDGAGGMQRQLVRIARACREQGAEVTVFASRVRGEPPAGLDMRLLPNSALTNHGRNLRFGRDLARAAAGRFDVIVGFTKLPGLDVYYAADPCYAARCRRERGWLYRLTPRYQVLHALEAAVFGRGRGVDILLISHGEQAKFIAHYATEPERFHLLPPGLEANRFRGPAEAGERAAVRAALGMGADGLLILTVATRFHTKGVDRVLRAVAALPDALRRRVRLLVVGGDDSAPLEKLADGLGIADRATFAGALQDLAPYYRAADLLAHPARTENTGNTLLEAMLCGLPVLATASCGYAEHVARADAGLICPEPYAQTEFERLLVEALQSPLRPQWRDNGRRYCERTDLYGLIDRAADVILDRARRNRECGLP